MNRAQIELDIIELISKGQRDSAIKLIMDNYEYALYGVSYKILKDEALAKDVYSISMVKIWNNLDKYNEEKSTLFTWMYRIIRNTSIDKARTRSLKNTKVCRNESEDGYILSDFYGKVLHQNTNVIGLDDNIDKLDDKYSFVLREHYLIGRTHLEISEIFGIPLGTVKSRILIAMREMRKIYGVKSLEMSN